MRRGNDIWPDVVHLRVDGEGRCVHHPVTVHDLTQMVDTDEVAGLDVSEVHAEGVHPEAVCELRIARRDVAGHTLVEPIEGEESQRGGKALLAVGPLLVQRGEVRNLRDHKLPRAGGLSHDLPSSRLMRDGQFTLRGQGFSWLAIYDRRRLVAGVRERRRLHAGRRSTNS